MNLIYNPVLLSKIVKSYLIDFNRLARLNQKELERFRDKSFRKIVRYAYTVPMYHEIYKRAGLYPNDIRSIKDIRKLPFVSKDDIKKYYPDGLISSKIDRKNLIEITTSGTSGKSVSIFVDPFDTIQGLLGYMRALKEFDINWRKDRLTIIADFRPHTAESGYINRGILKENSFLMKNIQWLDTNDRPEELIERIDKFKPDFIGAYVGMIAHLAVLKEKGFGKNVNPRVIGVTGAVFDKPLREFVYNVFGSEIFEAYGTTETGPIAFTCRKGEYHVLSDYVYLEVIEEGRYVPSGELGHAVVTKLYGKGTPIIRYTSTDDIVSLLDKNGTCGLSGDLLGNVYGRDILSLYLRDGNVALPAYITKIFSKILYVLKTNKIADSQVIQHDFDKFEIRIVFDKKLIDVPPTKEEIFSFIKKEFTEKIGNNISIVVKEVEEINRNEPRIISKIDKEKFKVKGYLV